MYGIYASTHNAQNYRTVNRLSRKTLTLTHSGLFKDKNNLKIRLGQHPCLSDLRHLATVGAQI